MRILARATILAVLVAVVVAAVPHEAQAIVGADIRGGFYTEPDDFFLGGGVRIGAAMLEVVPNFEYVFVSDQTWFTLNLDGQYSLIPFGLGSFWVGAGLGMFSIKPKDGDTNTEGLVNLLAGLGLNVPLKPYAQAKYIITKDSQVVLSLGVRF
jgi:hypothetical protein